MARGLGICPVSEAGLFGQSLRLAVPGVLPDNPDGRVNFKLEPSLSVLHGCPCGITGNTTVIKAPSPGKLIGPDMAWVYG